MKKYSSIDHQGNFSHVPTVYTQLRNVESFIIKYCVARLEAAMWREIGIKLALLILPTVPAYHGWAVEKMSSRLEHAFVPCLKAFKVGIFTSIVGIITGVSEFE